MNNRNRKYSNGTITVIWQPAECIHAGICFSKLRKVFDPIKRPWVNMAGASTDEIIDIVEQCPTKALTFLWDDPTANGAAATSPKICKDDLSRLFPTTHSDGINHTNDINDTNDNMDGTGPAAKITIRPGGPLVIEGEFNLVDGEGKPIQPRLKMASLCRCGLSDNQPFCDGAHFKAGFRK